MVNRINDYVYCGKFITFEKSNNAWEVYNTKSGYSLGYIDYFKKWKKFCFFPMTDTVFEEICLRDISSFIVDRTKEFVENDNK